MRRWLLPVLAASLCPSCGEELGSPSRIALEARRGDVLVRTTVEPSTITIAQRARLTLTVESDDGSTIGWPEIPGSIGELRIVERTARETVITPQGRRTGRQSFVLEPFLPGEFHIPGWEFDVPGGPLATPEITLVVTGAEVDLARADVGEARPIRELSMERPIWPFPASIVCIAASAVFWRAWARGRHPASPPPLSMPEVAARLEGIIASLERGAEVDPSAALDAMHRLPVMAAEWRARLDIARFSPAPPDRDEALAIARGMRSGLTVTTMPAEGAA